MNNFLTKQQAEQLVSQYGSPLYVYDKATLVSKIQNLKNMFEVPSVIKYAIKANYNPTLAKIVLQNGLEIDAVSQNECELALRCGAKPSQILFTESNANDEQIDWAVAKSIKINCGSISRLQKLGQKYPELEIFCRITTKTGDGHHSKTSTYGLNSKFGIFWEDVPQMKQIIDKYNLNLIGLHQHIGSGIYDIASFEKVVDPFLEFAKNFETVKYLDFGGGFATRYKEGENELDIGKLGAFMDQKILQFELETGRKIIPIIEPGRYVVNDCGILLTTCTTLKQNSIRNFAGVDTGFNHLIRYAMYESYHHIVNYLNLNGQEIIYNIAGNMCESSDFLARDRKMPEIREGDILGILSCGAYGMCMASNYNLQPLPAEVLVLQSGITKLIRKRQSFEDIFNCSEV